MSRHTALIALLLSGASFVSCAQPRTASPTTPIAPPSIKPLDEKAAPVAEGVTLPVVLAARIDAAMKAVALFDRDFAGLSSFRPCVLVFGAEREFVFQCPRLAGVSGFADTHATFGNAPVWTAPTFVLPGQSFPFEKVKMVVGRAGGSVRLPNAGGEPTPSPFFLVQDLDSLHAHHPAFTDTNAEDWTAIFVHEYFHVFQFGQPGVASFVKEWPKDWAQRDDHSKLWKDTSEYRDAVEAEVAILKGGLAPAARSTSKTILAKWLVARDKRMKTWKSAFEKASGKAGFEETDGFFTFLEGTARYLEVRFLCDKGLDRPDMTGDPSFKRFEAFARCSLTKVAGRDRTSGDFHYQLGMLVSAHLDAVNVGWRETMFARPGFLIGEARAAVEKRD
jgi:hypothetical protein